MGEHIARGDIREILRKAAEISRERLEESLEVILYLGKEHDTYYLYMPKQYRHPLSKDGIKVEEGDFPGGNLIAVIHSHEKIPYPSPGDLYMIRREKKFRYMYLYVMEFNNCLGSEGFLVFDLRNVFKGRFVYHKEHIERMLVGFYDVNKGKIIDKALVLNSFRKLYDVIKEELKKEVLETLDGLFIFGNIITKSLGGRPKTKREILEDLIKEERYPLDILEEVTQLLERRSQGNSQ